MSDQQQPREARPKRHARRPLVWLGRIVVFLAAVILAGTLYESVAEAADRRAYPAPGVFADAGGHSLHINCRGTGRPTVVIESGLGDWSASWSSWVQPEVARTTRVCTYDRAGMGWSAPGPLPRTAEMFARELHTALQRADMQGPYLLVGHSLGGLTVRLFAHEYPADVAGLVLIESMHPEQAAHAAPATPPETAAPTSRFSILTFAARIGLVRILAGPLGLRGGLSPEVADAYVAFSTTPRHLQTMEDEGAGMGMSLAQAAAVTSLGDLPLIVVSRGLDPDPKWQRMQADLVRLSSSSEQRIADKSGHNVQLDQPEAAIDAIVQMVQRLRRDGLR